MTKLTKYTRECIAKAATAFAFDSKQEALGQAEDALAREAYASLFKASELAQVNKLPSNWIRRDQCLRFNAAGIDARLFLIGEGLPVPYRVGEDTGYSLRLGTIEMGDLADRILAHMQLVEKTKKERSTAYYQVLRMLEKISTIKRLRETWPDGEQFYAKYENVPSAQLPAVRVEEINAMLGLAA